MPGRAILDLSGVCLVMPGRAILEFKAILEFIEFSRLLVGNAREGNT